MICPYGSRVHTYFVLMPEAVQSLRRPRPAPKPASPVHLDIARAAIRTSRTSTISPPSTNKPHIKVRANPGILCDISNTTHRCLPVPSHAFRPPQPAAASTPPLARWARPTTTPRVLAATFPSTRSPSGSLLGTGLSWVCARNRERYGRVGKKRLTIGTAVGFGAPFGIAGKFLELWRRCDWVTDGIHSLADIQELEDELLKLEEGIALWWCTRWRPPGLGGGLHHTGICNVYNKEFPSSHRQTLFTYMSQPFPMYCTAPSL